MSQRFADATLAFYGHAARLLGWKPADFWAATPAELFAALAPPAAPPALHRADLERMMGHDDG